MNRLNEIEERSIFIIREAFNKFKNPTVLWSSGKDSTVLLWLCKKAFYGKVPFHVLHIDTGYKFKEMYEFRDTLTNEWNLKLQVAYNKDADTENKRPEIDKFGCCNARKTTALKQAVKEHDIDALFVGIRRDENGIRNKERFFSPRDKDFHWNIVKDKIGVEGDSPFESLQDVEFASWNIYATDFGETTDHVRIHPLLEWGEHDIWSYILQEQIPIIKLYFSKNGKRYRSIGCECCSSSIVSEASTIPEILDEIKKTTVAERAGRDQDKEGNMQKLRSLGYM